MKPDPEIGISYELRAKEKKKKKKKKKNRRKVMPIEDDEMGGRTGGRTGGWEDGHEMILSLES